MKNNWSISSLNGVLLATYFIPAWTIVAFRIMISPVHALYERPNIGIGLFISDHLQLASTTTVRVAWLLALGRLTAVAFLACYVALVARPSVRRGGGCNELLAMALAIGGLISFVSMLTASQVGEIQALRLHASELLLLLGTAIVLTVERSAQPEGSSSNSGDVLLQRSELPNHR